MSGIVRPICRASSRGIGRALDLGPARRPSLRELFLRAEQARVRALRQSEAIQQRAQRRDQCTHCRTRQISGRARHVERTGVFRKCFELPAARNRDELRALLERAARHRDGLFGVAGVRHRERERVRPDVGRRADLLQHRDRHRQLVVEGGGHDVAGDPGAAHPQHHDVADAVGARQRVGETPSPRLRARRPAARATRRPRRGTPENRSRAHGRRRVRGVTPARSSASLRRPRPSG